MMPTSDPFQVGPDRDRPRDDRPPGIVPASERGQDPLREEIEHELGSGMVPPELEHDHDHTVEDEIAKTQRVYAPPSERVPREPLPGHRDLVEHTDDATPERQSAHPTKDQPNPTPGSATQSASTPGQAPVADAARPSYAWNPTPATPTYQPDAGSFHLDRRTGLGIGAGWLALIGCGVGVWLYLRWRRERNKPINRLRRQALRAASEVRARVPSPEDVMHAIPLSEEQAKPAASAAAMLLSLAVLILRRMRQPSEFDERRKEASDRFERATERARAFDWQERLASLRNGGSKLTAR